MTVDRNVLHRASSPHELLRSALMRFSVHVSEQCAAVYITDDSQSIASWLLTALFRNVPHRAPIPHELLRSALMQLLIHVSE